MEEGVRYIGQFNNGMRNGKGKQVFQDYTLYEGFWNGDQASRREDSSIQMEMSTKETGKTTSSMGKAFCIVPMESPIQANGLIISSTDTGSKVARRLHLRGRISRCSETRKGQTSLEKWSSLRRIALEELNGWHRQNGLSGWQVVQRRMEGKQNGGEGNYEMARWSYLRGRIRQNKREGFGRMRWPNGCEYEGQWLQGRQHGAGFYRGEDGVEWRCQWENGRRLD